MKNVLVIAAHPDDEVLGCGGTIASHIRRGDRVDVLILAEGATSRDMRRNPDHRKAELSALAKYAQAAADILGTSSLTLQNLPDNRFDSLDLLDIVKLVESRLSTIRPDTVYTHHSGDVNIDHRRIHEAVVTACRPYPGQSVRTLLFFEVQSSTEWQVPHSAPAFVPDWFVDISATLETKTAALQAYADEMRPWPHSRSIEAVEHLARWRGSIIGCAAAEAFVLGRHISKDRGHERDQY